jgi:hypothetical protein
VNSRLFQILASALTTLGTFHRVIEKHTGVEKIVLSVTIFSSFLLSCQRLKTFYENQLSSHLLLELKLACPINLFLPIFHYPVQKPNLRDRIDPIQLD